MGKSESLALVFGEKEKFNMNPGQGNNLNQEVAIYTDETFDFGEEVQDFLPSPEALAKAPRRVNVTISLDIETVTLLKQVAKKRNLSHQDLIEKLLETYTYRKNQHSPLPEVVMG